MNMNRIIRLATAVALFTAAGAQAAPVAAPAGARAYIIAPQDGQTVPATFTVRFGLEGMGVAPAGTERANTGHHHLLVDVATLPPLDAPLPATDQIRHFGGGQTETSLTLQPGRHTLQLLLGDQNHTPHAPAVLSEKITVTVE